MIEAVVWIGVFISAMLALTTSVLYFYRISNYTIQQATATASAQRGIDSMVRTIREASYASNGAYPVVSLSDNDFKFYADIDNDLGIERIRYYLLGSQLFKGVVEPMGDPAVYTGVEATSSVSEYVQNLNKSTALFTYYDKNGAQVTDYSKIADVRFVAANLLIDVDTNKTPIPLNLRSTAAMRNLIGL